MAIVDGQAELIGPELSRERSSRSTGLGLATVAGVVAAHGGALRITNEDFGATVPVSLNAG